MTRGTRRARAAFTLIEMLAVVFLMSVVLLGAVRFYFDLSNAGIAATDQTRRSRRAAALLDRVARDLRAAYLVVKPEEVDPLDHPWIFLAEEGDPDVGADRLKFVKYGDRARGSESKAWGFEMVAYRLRASEDGSYELLRWSSPHLPESLDRGIPEDESEGAQVLASGLAGFGVMLAGDEGEWKAYWDSSTLTDSSNLPQRAEIRLALAEGGGGPAQAAAFAPATAERDLEWFTEQVALPMRPVDLEALLQGQGAAEGQEEDPECITVAECRNALLASPDVRVGPAIIERLAEQPDVCVEDVFQSFDVSECPQ